MKKAITWFNLSWGQWILLALGAIFLIVGYAIPFELTVKAVFVSYGAGIIAGISIGIILERVRIQVK